MTKQPPAEVMTKHAHLVESLPGTVRDLNNVRGLRLHRMTGRLFHLIFRSTIK